MGKKRINWKIPVIAALALLLTLEIVDTCRMAYGGDGRALPVLMYHHFDETSKDGTVVPPPLTESRGIVQQSPAVVLRALAPHSAHAVPAAVAVGLQLDRKSVV